MIPLYQLGPAGYWTGQTQQVEDDAVVPSGWTARPLPDGLQAGQHVRLTLTGWEVTDQAAPEAAPGHTTPPAKPELVVISVAIDAEHAGQALINGVADVTCPVGSTLSRRFVLLRGGNSEKPLLIPHKRTDLYW